MRAGPLELIYRDVIFGRYYHNDFMPSSSGDWAVLSFLAAEPRSETLAAF